MDVWVVCFGRMKGTGEIRETTGGLPELDEEGNLFPGDVVDAWRIDFEDDRMVYHTTFVHAANWDAAVALALSRYETEVLG